MGPAAVVFAHGPLLRFFEKVINKIRDYFAVKSRKNRYAGRMMIISGGQTGVDRAALDVAIALGLPHGGLVPMGRLAEDGKLPRQYKVKEMPSKDYAERTRANVDWADATLVIYRGRIMGGTLLTWEYARNRARPALLVDLATEPPPKAIPKILKWLGDYTPAVLNVAGPRESTHPGIYEESAAILRKVFTIQSQKT